eukprot:15000975-Alexandrium_andersonii.AAC.1
MSKKDMNEKAKQNGREGAENPIMVKDCQATSASGGKQEGLSSEREDGGHERSDLMVYCLVVRNMLTEANLWG